MKQRVRKIDRILKVQKHLQKEAELKLSKLEREAMELKAAQEAIIETMNDHETLHGLFVDVASRRLQALAAQETRVETAKTAQRAVALDRGMQAKRTEKMLSGLKDQQRRDDEKKSLASILEAMARGKSASFP
ncbi:hypothetical protein [Microvirga arsenatis]|uniref:Flagellar export protein FliJ n=1 Tax=Microvirga arsenatis TaxID=2692265 RepID=A0ABW9YY69_9HYPH|nr:hypothetical protein [Microvirga arsenatis]NBJ11031.1 hypothetical protein [Microvirga arsenatis]NBJ25304.1 hypothetical protein [Microvirga arsenatis]